jgi:type II secretory ATPase GspE/PulE/Tfp pilus assembly ATPase PilB-like protein
VLAAVFREHAVNTLLLHLLNLRVEGRKVVRVHVVDMDAEASEKTLREVRLHPHPGRVFSEVPEHFFATTSFRGCCAPAEKRGCDEREENTNVHDCSFRAKVEIDPMYIIPLYRIAVNMPITSLFQGYSMLKCPYMTQFDDTRTNTRMAELHHREEEALVRTLAPQYGYEYVDLSDTPIDVAALRTFTEAESRKAEAALFGQGNGTVSVAIRNPNHPETLPFLEHIVERGQKPLVYMTSMHSLEHAWARYHDGKQTVAETRGVLDVNTEAIERYATEIKTHLDVGAKIATVQKEGGSEKISKTLELLFGGALALRASDIHIEPAQSSARIRYRLDGVLADVTDLDRYLYDHVISRLKLLSGLKLNVHKEAQDGRFTIDVGNREIEVRSSVIPGGYGESIVMRLLDPSAANFQFEKLGLNARLHEVMLEELARPNGGIVTTGPTGSGKTTALYAFLQQVHTPQIKIITLEDPIEYKLPGIVQTQVSGSYTFAEGLRSILRQDPDVIMVGEIRDREVAETAVHAALTGHLVFSTLHTNSAVGGFARLTDLGVDPRMIASAFNIILGQRLVRKLCEHCKVARETTAAEQQLIGTIMDRSVPLSTIYEAPGCEQCGFSGYKGRIGVVEGVRVDEAVESAILSDPREVVILEAAKPQNIPSMQQDGIMKVLAGITSLDELSRVLDLYGAQHDKGNA